MGTAIVFCNQCGEGINVIVGQKVYKCLNCGDVICEVCKKKCKSCEKVLCKECNIDGYCISYNCREKAEYERYRLAQNRKISNKRNEDDNYDIQRIRNEYGLSIDQAKKIIERTSRYQEEYNKFKNEYQEKLAQLDIYGSSYKDVKEIYEWTKRQRINWNSGAIMYSEAEDKVFTRAMRKAIASEIQKIGHKAYQITKEVRERYKGERKGKWGI